MMQKQSGFTLPEVLIALLIFSMISAACVYSLRLGVDSRDQLAETDDIIKELQIARALVKEDFAQVTTRSVRDEFGNLAPTFFYGGQTPFFRRPNDDETILVVFVRDGWINPGARAPRSSLQYVEYILRNNSLIRRARIYLDDANRSDSIEKVLFEDVAQAEIEFLLDGVRREIEWADFWPVDGTQSLPPKAVALTLTSTTGETLRQLFWIGEVGRA